MKESNNKQSIPEEYPEKRKDIARLLAAIEKRPAEDRERLLKTLQRYESEAEKNAYQSDTSGLVGLIAERGLLKSSPSLVDLGAGSGDLIAELARQYPGKKFLGFDLSPRFVQNFNTKKVAENVNMRIGLIDSPEIMKDSGTMKKGGVISVLTLDRVADPQQLIVNMSQFSGKKILATLLPVNPIDDNPSIVTAGTTIEYTRKENRITSGVSAEEDGQELLKLLTKVWGDGVRVDTVPYSVASSGDIQLYELAVFSK